MYPVHTKALFKMFQSSFSKLIFLEPSGHTAGTFNKTGLKSRFMENYLDDVVN